MKGRDEGRGDEKIFREVDDELPGADIPEAHTLISQVALLCRLD
jgi:hypothetical protein